MALPITALTLANITGSYLLTRNSMISILKAPFMLLGKAKGLSQGTLKYHYAGRNSLLPVFTMTGIRFSKIVTGTLFVELV